MIDWKYANFLSILPIKFTFAHATLQLLGNRIDYYSYHTTKITVKSYEKQSHNLELAISG